MVLRVATAVESLLDELGQHGRLLRLQLEELSGDVAGEQRLVLEDYLDEAAARRGASGGAGRGAGSGEGGERGAVAGPRQDGLDGRRGGAVEEALRRLRALDTDELLGVDRFVAALSAGARPPGLDSALEPRGVRLLRRVPELHAETISQLLGHFAGLHEIVRATAGELAAASELSDEQARLVKEGLAHLAESSILDRYH